MASTTLRRSSACFRPRLPGASNTGSAASSGHRSGHLATGVPGTVPTFSAGATGTPGPAPCARNGYRIGGPSSFGPAADDRRGHAVRSVGAREPNRHGGGCQPGRVHAQGLAVLEEGPRAVRRLERGEAEALDPTDRPLSRDPGPERLVVRPARGDVGGVLDAQRERLTGDPVGTRVVAVRPPVRGRRRGAELEGMLD